MTRRDLMSLFGRLGLIVMAFTLVTGIIAAPLLKRIWGSPMMVAE